MLFRSGWVGGGNLSEVIWSKGKQSEHEGRGMHITSTHPHPHGVWFFRCVTVTSVLLQSVHRSFLCVATTREIRKLLICIFLSPVKNKASIIVDVEVNLG